MSNKPKCQACGGPVFWGLPRNSDACFFCSKAIDGSQGKAMCGHHPKEAVVYVEQDGTRNVRCRHCFPEAFGETPETPDIIGLLHNTATDHEWSTIHEVLVRAGVYHECACGGWTLGPDDTACEACGAERPTAP